MAVEKKPSRKEYLVSQAKLLPKEQQNAAIQQINVAAKQKGGITKDKLPPMPPKNLSSTDRSICGNVKGTKRCTQYQREYTPDDLINWMTKVCNELQKP